MTTVYIDEVFALNAAADGFLLYLTARLAGIPPRRGRVLLAALAGGLYACGAALPGFWASGAVKCAAGVGLALVAFGQEDRLFRLTALFFAVSCAFAGCVLAMSLAAGSLYAAPYGGGLSGAFGAESAGIYGAETVGGLYAYGSGDLRLLSCAALCTVGVLAAGRRAARRHGTARLLSVRLCLLGHTAELSALWDSGNGLRENGEPVLILSPALLRDILPPDAAAFLTPARLRSPETLLEPLMVRFPELRPRLVPYRAVGVASGLLLTVESQWTEVDGKRRPGGRLALSPTELGDGLQALWGGG